MEHYNDEDAGWDIVAESWDDEAIIKAIGPSSKPETAINRVGKLAVVTAHRKDIVSA